MNHRHRKVLHALFEHPVSANIHARDVESVFKELGADLGHTGSGRLSVQLAGHSAAFHAGGHSVSKQEVTQIRKFLTTCDVDPVRDYPL